MIISHEYEDSKTITADGDLLDQSLANKCHHFGFFPTNWKSNAFARTAFFFLYKSHGVKANVRHRQELLFFILDTARFQDENRQSLSRLPNFGKVAFKIYISEFTCLNESLHIKIHLKDFHRSGHWWFFCSSIG